MGSPSLAASYVSQVDAMAKLDQVDSECILSAQYYVPTGKCQTQTYLVEFNSQRDQNYIGQTNDDSLQATLNILDVSAFELNGMELADMIRDPGVKTVTPNIQVSIAGTQNSAPWHLDRLDQQSLPLNSSYAYQDNAQGAGVRVYVVDTGINSTHTEFTGRLIPGYSAIGTTTDTEDCNGHGSHVAGLAAGTTYGTAKQATLVPVRVLDCAGNGSLLGVLQGLDWVANNTQVGQPAVVNMSLGGDPNTYLDNAIGSLTSQGLAFVVAAGNSGADACNTSPARVAGAITVAASSRTDTWPSFSNYGSCVDVIAPGDALTSAWIGSSSAIMGASGTSMAAGVVSGIVAMQMSFGYQSPADLSNALTLNAASNKIAAVPANTPNKLVQNYVAFSTAGTAPSVQPGGITVPADSTPVSVVDPITSPAPSPNPGTELPVAYSKPSVIVVDGTATITWTIPIMTSPLVGQTLAIYSGTTLLQQVSLGATETSYLFTSLAPGVVYKVSILGLNLNGAGPESEFSDPFGSAGSVLLGPEGGEFSAWTKKINDTQVKFYAKYPQLGQKIQFMVQQPNGTYKEVAWIRITQDRINDAGEYIGLTNGVYFIRTINLVEGKNRLRIMVDGRLLGTTRTYTR